MSGDTPTDRYFPATLEKKPDREHDIVSRVLALAAILLVGLSYMWSYKQQVDDVDRARSQCIREQRDLRIELQAWEEVSAYGPSVEPQIDRLGSIIRRNCNQRHPDPGLF